MNGQQFPDEPSQDQMLQGQRLEAYLDEITSPHPSEIDPDLADYIQANNPDGTPETFERIVHRSQGDRMLAELLVDQANLEAMRNDNSKDQNLVEAHLLRVRQQIRQRKEELRDEDSPS